MRRLSESPSIAPFGRSRIDEPHMSAHRVVALRHILSLYCQAFSAFRGVSTREHGDGQVSVLSLRTARPGWWWQQRGGRARERRATAASEFRALGQPNRGAARGRETSGEQTGRSVRQRGSGTSRESKGPVSNCDQLAFSGSSSQSKAKRNLHAHRPRERGS